MTDPPKPVSDDEIYPVCSKPKSKHNLIEIYDCSNQLVEMGLMRYCGICGLTKPTDSIHDRCGKCGEKYSFTNE